MVGARFRSYRTLRGIESVNLAKSADEDEADMQIMKPDPRLSVVLPTRKRPETLRTCLARLACQHAGTAPFEVVVALDGADPDSERVAGAFTSRLDLQVIRGPRQGNAASKNRAIQAARGELLLFVNDDVIPEPGFVAAHEQAHAALGEISTVPPLVLGYSPFVEEAEETLFARLVRETSMVFFYDRMLDRYGNPRKPPEHDWGFRHAWTLNLSVPAAAVRNVGGFRPALANCCYEDIELAWRLRERFGSPVLFRPEARAPHHHVYTPASYLEREFRLGYSAYGFAVAAPACAVEVFGRDLLDPRELEYARSFVEHESRDEEAVRPAFDALGEMPASMLGGGAEAERLGRMLWAQHLPLKRLAFRRGLVAAAEMRRIEGLFHPRDALESEPGLARQTAA